MIADEDVVRVAAARGQFAPGPRPDSFTFLFDVAAYSPNPGPVGSPARSGRCAVAVPLPSSPDGKPWLYIDPDDAADYLNQLDTFVEEQVLTGCLTWARQERVEGIRIFFLAPYGFEHASRAEHDRLLEAAGPGGWYDPRIE